MNLSKPFLYISGPMSGYPEHNFPLFFEAEEKVRIALPQYSIVNPARLPGGAWSDCIRRDIVIVMNPNCKGLVLLDNWTESLGAKLESYTARVFQQEFYRYTNKRVVTYEIKDEDLTYSSKTLIQKLAKEKGMSIDEFSLNSDKR